MKDISNLRIIILALGMVFVFLSINNYNIFHNQGNNDGTIEIRDEFTLKNLKRSGSHIESFIHIDGNWSVTASTYAWCSGDGSWGNPYIIEDVIINASTSPTGCGILINNSKTEYFIIRNCTVHNAGDAGIRLENTNNGSLINNTFTYNTGHGIFLRDFCENNNVSENDASNNDKFGISLNTNCSHNTISRNTVNDNWWTGIRGRYSCKNNIISGNTISNNNWEGIYLDENCDNNLISGNTGTFNGRYGGIRLELYCDNNIISGNTANYNTDYGIYLAGGCVGNTISGNIANNNWFDGIKLFNSDNNTILGNTANNNRYGVYLEETSYSIILGNDLSNNHYGIFLEYSNYSFISENTANYNDCGIYLSGCNSSTISGNNASYNNVIGIALDKGNNNIFIGNIVNDNIGYGIYLSGCNSSTISGNNASYNKFGILLFSSDYINISNNIVSNNGNTGIILRDCDGGTITGNTIYYNNQYGVSLNSACDDNLFYLNSFIGNVYHARDPGNNQWDNGIYGNYWDNYSGYDLLPIDGIGDTPYSLPVDKYDTKPLIYIGLDTDGDGFSDSDEAGYGTNALDASWYPMPNLKVSHFSSVVAYQNRSFTLYISITNNGIWKAVGVVVVIRCEELNLTLYNSPFNIDVDDTRDISIGCSPFEITGEFTLSLIVDPDNLINEAYSLKNGSLRTDWELDNSMQAILSIISMKDNGDSGGGGAMNPVLIFSLGSIAGVAVGAIATLGINRLRKRRKLE